MLKRGRPHGFSMIELLIVIGLIAFMLVFLVIAFLNHIQTGKIEATRIQLKKITLALEQYYQEFREYPPDSGYGLKPEEGKSGKEVRYDAGSLFRYLGRPITWMKRDESGALIDKGTFGPYAKFEERELKAYKDPVDGDSFMVVDTWGTPIGYIGNRSRVIHNRNGVDLFSAGPDRKTASDDTGFDHKWPPGTAHDNQAYDGTDNDGDGIPDNATELGYATLNGSLTQFKKDKNINTADPKKSESLDDVNSWDPH